MIPEPCYSFVRPNCKYRILDSNWFPLSNALYVHLAERDEQGVIKRIYMKIDKPEYTFYFGENITKRCFQKERSELVAHTCQYNNRYLYIADLLNFNKETLRNPDLKRKARTELMASPKLFRADDRIETQVMDEVTKRLKQLDVYDEGIKGKRLFFDIETSGIDFSAEELDMQYLLLKSNSTAEFAAKVSSDSRKIRTMAKYPNMIDSITEYFSNIDIDFNPVFHRFLTEIAQNPKYEADFPVIKRKIKKFIRKYELNVGEVNEVLANDRIDTITSFDGEILYQDYLIKEELLPTDFLELLTTDIPRIEQVYGNYLRMAMFKFDINNLGKKEKEALKKEFGEDELKRFFTEFEAYGIDDDIKNADGLFKTLMHEFVLGKFDKYSKFPTFKFVFKTYRSEIKLVHSFLERVKNDIKPSYMVAHNHRYDLLYIKNRTLKFGYNPAEWFCQYPIDQIKETLDLDTVFKFDDKADNRKHEKSAASGLGLIQADTLLLNAKASFKEQAWGLDPTLERDFGEKKFKYKAKSIVSLYENPDHFIKYSNIDTLSIDQIDGRKGLIELRQSMLEGATTWSRYYTASEITTNTMKLLYSDEYGLQIQNNPNNYLADQGELLEEGLVGGFVTDPSEVGTTGIFKYAEDFDASAMYPSIMRTNNSFADTLIIRFMDEAMFRQMKINPTKYVELAGGKSVKRMLEEMIALKNSENAS